MKESYAGRTLLKEEPEPLGTLEVILWWTQSIHFWILNILCDKGYCFVGGHSLTGFWTSIVVPNCKSHFGMARPHFSRGQPTGHWRSFQSINSNERKPQLCCKVDSDQRLTHSTHDRKLNFYTYLVLDSIKTKTERQGQLRHHVFVKGIDLSPSITCSLSKVRLQVCLVLFGGRVVISCLLGVSACEKCFRTPFKSLWKSF